MADDPLKDMATAYTDKRWRDRFSDGNSITPDPGEGWDGDRPARRFIHDYTGEVGFYPPPPDRNPSMIVPLVFAGILGMAAGAILLGLVLLFGGGGNG
jgi:hypothetical protein